MSGDGDDLAAGWTIERIRGEDDDDDDDGEGCRFYLEQYKPFRLAALEADPDAFGSTYLREAAFSDEVWLSRARNPLTRTLVAVSRSRILGATTLVGPLPATATTVSDPQQAVVVRPQPPTTTTTTADETSTGSSSSSSRFQLAGVYVRGDARGRGLGAALVRRAVAEAEAEAQRQTQTQAKKETTRLHLSVVVYARNEAAIRMYERGGFVRDATRRAVFNPLKNESADELCLVYNAGDG
ncbi:hypothetical protein F4780DRAFT_323804 [Xylariomycetidae sp. FL0641]|nr:hypothetical protein F4780DRAFT_323804 [Xylariomycetidae sp. FL0641]